MCVCVRAFGLRLSLSFTRAPTLCPLFLCYRVTCVRYSRFHAKCGARNNVAIVCSWFRFSFLFVCLFRTIKRQHLILLISCMRQKEKKLQQQQYSLSSNMGTIVLCVCVGGALVLTALMGTIFPFGIAANECFIFSHKIETHCFYCSLCSCVSVSVFLSTACAMFKWPDSLALYLKRLATQKRTHTHTTECVFNSLKTIK